MPILQGFEEVNIAEPTQKVIMTVTDSLLRFNKATAAQLGYPAYIKVLVNSKTQQIALQVCTGRESNAIAFSKPEGKQTASITVRNEALVASIGKFFTFKSAPAELIPYQSVPGKPYHDDKTVIFDVSDATPGTMKRRGRKKSVK